jgi:phospholipase/carboxylesterase
MELVRLGDLDVRLVGDRAGSGPVIVLLHGFGAPGDDLVALGRYLRAPDDVRFVFPQAPHTLPMMFGDSRAWWMIDLEAREQEITSGGLRDLSSEHPEGLEEVNASVNSVLDAIESDFNCPGERIVLGGFSQGAMLACDVALRSERQLAGLVLLSTTLLCADEWLPRMSARSGLRVLQSHGSEDPLLPFAMAERLRDHLREAGATVDWSGFPGGHEIPPPVLTSMIDFVADVL